MGMFSQVAEEAAPRRLTPALSARSDEMTDSAASFEGSSRDSQAPAIDEGTWYMSPTVMNSPTRRRIRRAVYGDEFPEDADPSSYITLTELRRIARDLRVGPGDTFVDLGCGRGGPGLWVARETGADVVGIDLAPMAVEYSTQTAAEFGLSARASYQVSDFCSTSIPSGSLSGAMSVDVLWAVPDKAAALREAARILRPGGRFIFTSWDFTTPREGDTQVSDHRPLLHEAGFTVDAYEETAGFDAYYQALAQRHEAARDDLIAEMGERFGNRFIGMTSGNAAIARRRVLVVARLPE